MVELIIIYNFATILANLQRQALGRRHILKAFLLILNLKFGKILNSNGKAVTKRLSLACIHPAGGADISARRGGGLLFRVGRLPMPQVK